MPISGFRTTIANARILRAQAQEVRAKSRRLRGASDQAVPPKQV
jgi:hypothetical protein